MNFWLREIAGWALVGIGLFGLWLTYQFGKAHLILEMWPLALVSVFVFRGGIHLLKVAVAARICRAAQDRLYPIQPPGVQSRVPARPTALRRR